jgi:pumilio RNA-binding family
MMCARAMRGQVLQLSMQMYGCRVVQKALEVCSDEAREEMVEELIGGGALECVRDQVG